MTSSGRKVDVGPRFGGPRQRVAERWLACPELEQDLGTDVAEGYGRG